MIHRIGKHLQWRTKRSVNAFVERYIMMSYPQKRKTILSYSKEHDIKCFVETGTLFGDTTEAMKEHAEEIFSIELSEELANAAKKRFENDAHVHIMQGDSGKVLYDILPTIQYPALFWLDGHYSGSFISGELSVHTALGDLQTPIIQELTAIFTFKKEKVVILIDDARAFTGKNDYPTYRSLRNFIRSNYPHCSIENKRDIIRIVID